MTKFTRRGALGLAGSGIGLAGCAAIADRPYEAPYAGGVAFRHGVASGDPLQDRVILWTRLSPDGSGPITVVWQVFADAGLTQQVAAGAVRTGTERDYTVKADAAGLQPGRDYYYVFSVNTERGPVGSPVGRTRTLAAAGSQRPVRAAVVSCSNYPFGFFHVYDALARQETPLDVIIHLGDYLYEYGPDGYGADVGKAIGRNHEPARETVSLEDYRTRHAQYRSDRALQDAHAAAPWICTWDDHESANNAYRTGAENHAGETEGTWSARKQQAVQAYLEWMPVRDPRPGAAREALWRRFDFGDVASIICLETRLSGRSEEITWGALLEDHAVPPDEVPGKVAELRARLNDPARTMLGAPQEAWLAEELKASAGSGKPWQVLANQVVMARVALPNFNETLTEEEKASIDVPIIQRMVQLSALGEPWNLDAWDGFPAARERLYAAAKSAQANLVTLTGDTHTGWANSLVDRAGEARGVEFGCTSVTSPGFGRFLPGIDGLGDMFTEANAEVDWHDPVGSGFTLLELTMDEVRAEFFKVSDVTQPAYSITRVAGFRTVRTDAAPLKLKKV